VGPSRSVTNRRKDFATGTCGFKKDQGYSSFVPQRSDKEADGKEPELTGEKKKHPEYGT